ncbi:MAG: ADP-ribosylglycohydrolase family protein [Escherichia coli]
MHSAAIGPIAVLQRRTAGTIHACANIGNDTDNIATMAGAIAGAWRGFDALLKINMPFSAP